MNKYTSKIGQVLNNKMIKSKKMGHQIMTSMQKSLLLKIVSFLMMGTNQEAKYKMKIVKLSTQQVWNLSWDEIKNLKTMNTSHLKVRMKKTKKGAILVCMSQA